MLQKFQSPYIFETAFAKRWRACLLYSLFVFAFLLVFQPFGLSALNNGLFKICLGYGLTTFLVMSLLNLVLPTIFPSYFSEERWTVGREIWWTIINISVIGLGNALYNNFLQINSLSFYSVVILEAYTLSVGVIPIAVTVLLKENRLKKKYETKSSEINAELKEQAIPETPKYEKKLPQLITLSSETGSEDLTIPLDSLLYMQSSENYVEVFYLIETNLSKKLLRNSLKSISESLIEQQSLFRCHKSYLVNLQKVDHVSGNAQGYKLHLRGIDTLVPVSRQLNTEIKNRLTISP